MPKLSVFIFRFHFLFSLNAALSSANSQHRKASAPSRTTPSLSVNIHNMSSLKLLSPLTLTQVPLKLRCTNLSFHRKLKENKHKLCTILIRNFYFYVSAEKYPSKLWNLFNLQKGRANWILSHVNYRIQRNNCCRKLQLYCHSDQTPLPTPLALTKKYGHIWRLPQTLHLSAEWQEVSRAEQDSTSLQPQAPAWREGRQLHKTHPAFTRWNCTSTVTCAEHFWKTRRSVFVLQEIKTWKQNILQNSKTLSFLSLSFFAIIHSRKIRE